MKKIFQITVVCGDSEDLMHALSAASSAVSEESPKYGAMEPFTDSFTETAPFYEFNIQRIA